MKNAQNTAAATNTFAMSQPIALVGALDYFRHLYHNGAKVGRFVFDAKGETRDKVMLIFIGEACFDTGSRGIDIAEAQDFFKKYVVNPNF